MNRFAAAHPEDWEDRIENMRVQADMLRKEQEEWPSRSDEFGQELRPCAICSEEWVRAPAIHCRRCTASLEEDRLNRDR